MIFILTFFISLLFTRLMIKVNIKTFPTERSSHNAPTPTAGGIGFAFAFFFAIFASYFFLIKIELSILITYFICSIILLVVGALDDFSPLTYRFRLFMHFICTILLVQFSFVIQFPVFNFSNNFIPWILTILSGIVLINATNFIDGLNGLLTGSYIIFLIFHSSIFLSSTSFYFDWMLISALLGFLVFNFPKAYIFMGDTGSTFLGLTIFFIALLTQNYYPSKLTSSALVNKGFIFTLIPLGFLWFDVLITFIRRIIYKKPLTQAHKDYIFHILLERGHTHTFISSLYMLATALMGMLTILCHFSIINFLTLVIIYSILQTAFLIWVFYKKSTR
ncbi:MAG: glycosyltransferase family 4 protein [Alphaproteobacteria bacterium]